MCLRDVTVDGIAEAFAEQGVTHLCGAPIVVNLAIQAMERAAPGRRIRMMTAGAAPAGAGDDPEAASQEILARCDGPAPAWWPNVGETGAPEPKAPQPEPETEPARAEVSEVQEQSSGLLSPGTAAALSGALAVETRRAAAAEAVAREAAGEPAYAGEVVVTGEVVAGEVPGEPVHAGETGRVDLADWPRSWDT